MYHFSNSVENRTGFTRLCAYSAPSPESGQPDIWKIGRLTSNLIVGNIDIDYIKPEQEVNFFRWKDTEWHLTSENTPGPKLIWRNNGWIKIRQSTKLWVVPNDSDPRTDGIIVVAQQILGSPTPALDESKLYDQGGPKAGSGDAQGRNTDAVKSTFAQWDSIISAGQFSMMPTKQRS